MAATARTLVLRPYAKVNLTLSVGAVRPDGFHAVETVLQSIAISDRLTITARRGVFELITRAARVPADRTNLVWRAAAAIWQAMGRSGEPRDARVALDKRIPVAAGLGGGSADAAAALLGFNALWNGRLTHADLARLAAGLGADVPFFLHGGTARGTGRGDLITPLDDVRRLAAVVLVPAFGVSAADAYRWLDEDRHAGRGAPAEGPANPVDLGPPHGRVTPANDLQAPVSRRHPEITEMIAACHRAGAAHAAMTGSGSAVFGLFTRPPSATALKRLKRPSWRVISTRTATGREASRRVGII